jgi:SAM-dependent methyltransferase
MIDPRSFAPLVGEAAVDEAAGATCWACGGVGLVPFYSADAIPTQSCVLLDTVDEAAAYPTGDLLLGFCVHCGFIENIRFDRHLVDYSKPTEESQAYSATFQSFARGLAERLHQRHDLINGDVLEIGCGKGDFLFLLADQGIHSGIGIDPGFLPNREESATAGLRFIKDWYDDRYAELTGSMLLTRHLYEHLDEIRPMTRSIVNAMEATPGSVLFTELPDAKRVFEEVAFWDIYYEHCSYFTMGSLGRLFRSFSLTQTEMEYGFGDQYLLVESVLDGNASPHPMEESVAETASLVGSFAVEAARRLDGWRTLADQSANRKVALWGGGSKAVAFLTTLGVWPDVAVVDINPHKQGKWLPGTRVMVDSPEVLADTGVDHVIIMNPIYEDEITSDLTAMGLAPQISTL